MFRHQSALICVTLLDALVLVALVVLARGFDKARVNDAAFSGVESFAFKNGSKAFEKLAAADAHVSFDALLEVPERLAIGDVAANPQAEKVFEAGAIKVLLLGRVIAKPLELLQHKDFEREHRIEGRLAALAPVAWGVAGEVLEQ